MEGGVDEGRRYVQLWSGRIIRNSRTHLLQLKVEAHFHPQEVDSHGYQKQREVFEIDRQFHDAPSLVCITTFDFFLEIKWLSLLLLDFNYRAAVYVR